MFLFGFAHVSCCQWNLKEEPSKQQVESVAGRAGSSNPFNASKNPPFSVCVDVF